MTKHIYARSNLLAVIATTSALPSSQIIIFLIFFFFHGLCILACTAFDRANISHSQKQTWLDAKVCEFFI